MPIDCVAFSEVLRVLDSLQLTMYHKVATPVNWRTGDRCMVLPSIKPEELASTYPKVRWDTISRCDDFQDVFA